MVDASTVVVLGAAVLATAAHGYMFTVESLLFGRPSTLQMLEVPTVHASTVRLWAFHQGVYNLLIAAICGAGIVFTLLGQRATGDALLYASTAAMVAAAIALIGVDRRRERIAGFIAQAVPPLVCLLALTGARIADM